MIGNEPCEAKQRRVDDDADNRDPEVAWSLAGDRLQDVEPGGAARRSGGGEECAKKSERGEPSQLCK